MKILIVGGRSSVGTAVASRLAPNAEVLTAGRSGCDVELDLSWERERMVLPSGVDLMIHTAAHFGGARPEDANMAERINALGSLSLCQAAAGAGVKRVILVSSVFALIPHGSRHFGAYPMSKRHSEDVARFACGASSMKLAILRPSQIYGAGQRSRLHQPFLYAMLDKARAGEDILLYGSHDPLRNFIHIDDVAAAIVRLVETDLEGCFACQHPTDVSYAQIAAAAFRYFGRGGNVRYLSEKPDIPDNVFPFDGSLYDAIGWRPQISIEEGIRRVALSA